MKNLSQTLKKLQLTLLTCIALMLPIKVFAENSFQYPVKDSYITRGYSSTHKAVDFQRKAHDKGFVGSIGSGKVVKVCKGYCGGYGYYVVVDHGNGYASLYSHLSGISVSNGQKVCAGSKIGNMGLTGKVRARYPILHLEIWKNGSKINPLNVMQ